MPIMLYVSITAFFFATIVRTIEARPWKSSTLALLQCGNPDNKMAGTKQFKAFAKSTKVRLEDNGETWHLVDSQQDSISTRELAPRE